MTRWLILVCTWVLLACLATMDTRAVRDYVAMLDDSGTLPPDSLPLKRSLPTEYSDAHTWVRYALAVQEGAPWQVRSTDIDNAPAGREVHWSSAFVHLVATAGRVQRAFSGEPLPTATENALAWFNLPLFLAVVIAFSAWVTARAGTPAGVLTALAMGGYRWFYDGFAPNYVDHHGLATAACFGVALGAVFMGAGWRRSPALDRSLLPSSRESARAAALVSAVAGGLGLWLSAASVIPTIGAVGVAGLLAGMWLGPRAAHNGLEFDGSIWRLWGRVGASVAIVGYLVEYAPHHFGMHLEVNHPLYALAWLGGAELVASGVEWRLSGIRVPIWRLTLAAIAVAAPVVVIAIWRSAVFAPLDPSIAQFHSGIEEFYSVSAFLRARGGDAAWRFAGGFLLLVPAGLAARSAQRDRLLLVFISAVVLPLVALACWEVRWWLMASGPQLCLLVVALGSVAAGRGRVHWTVSLVLGALFVEQFAARVHAWRSNVHDGAVAPADALQPMYRDAAAVIHASQPGGKVVLLASPNASTAIGYFGRFPTLASLYWENVDGMKAAAAIFSATNDDSARALIQARGVTHVAVVSANDFVRQYLELDRPGASPSELSRTFGDRLLRGARVRWLRPLPFRPRFPDPRDRALLFQVDPNQTDFEADWNTGIADAARGASSDAEEAFRSAVARAAPARSAELYQSAGMAAYQWHDHALAVRLLRASVSAHASASAAANLAWILATSTDDQVRNGPEALAIAESLARDSGNDPTALDILGAALAASGRFAEAAATAQRMLGRAQAVGDAAGAARAERRLQVYRSGRPWRQ